MLLKKASEHRIIFSDERKGLDKQLFDPYNRFTMLKCKVQTVFCKEARIWKSHITAREITSTRT